MEGGVSTADAHQSEGQSGSMEDLFIGIGIFNGLTDEVQNSWVIGVGVDQAQSIQTAAMSIVVRHRSVAWEVGLQQVHALQVVAFVDTPETAD